MLELKNIKKTYRSGDEKVQALKGVNLKFRESEFVSILGQSGCGKTTLLNIIGGLDRYTSGDLIIDGKSTKKYKDRDWDAYRNYKIGFVFQSYNLIGHQTILSNVELALTIGGVSKKERRQRAIAALEEVGLKEHIHKKPNQLSGGQMQRVAIARALVNNPEIILADEPTGALDTKTSVQVMEILKKISKNKLIIMVTHNPELAEQYSSRIIRILDGVITEDSNPISDKEKEEKENTTKIGRTSMKIWTAFRLSLNNLLTKKGRTILVSIAGSIGIIGIALVQSVSNGFQGYVDSIQEETLTSYPLRITQETSDLSGMLLAMTTRESENNNSGEVKENQYISNMLSNVSTNDLKTFKKYINDNKKEVENDVSSIMDSYSVEPNIYAKDATGKVAKLNPSNMFSSNTSSSFMMSATAVYSQMVDDRALLEDSYDVLAGHWPEKYNEMIIVLSEPNSISDLLIYSLGLRNTEELNGLVKKIMNAEKVDLNNEPMTLTYNDLMNIELRMIMPPDTYKYSEEYDIYEDMTDDEDYMNNLYDNAEKLKIVGVVTAKEGVTSTALNPGVAYTSGLVDHVIDYAKETDVVKKQLEDKEVDVFSGNRFDSKKNDVNLGFTDLVSVDSNKLKDVFDVKIDEKEVQRETENYMSEISESITTDITPAKEEFAGNLNTFANDVMDRVDGEISEDDINWIVDEYLDEYEPSQKMKNMEGKYVIPKDVYKQAYSGLLKAMLGAYAEGYKSVAQISALSSLPQSGSGATLPSTTSSTPSSSTGSTTPTTPSSSAGTQTPSSSSGSSIMPSININDMINELKQKVITSFIESLPVQQTEEEMAKVMTEATVKKEVLTKVGELTANLSSKFASAFNVDPDKFANAFELKLTEDEIARVVTAMFNKTEATAKTNLTSLGYQDKDEPTYISIYFTSFDGKENFLRFIDNYNEKVKAEGNEDKEINYTDTTGILMGSVKTIVNAVTYVLIAFISISLIVSSIMIGIITYISVYERTKEIGILRAMGASKHNISSIFNAETFIIGLLSGLFGIGITYALIPLINAVLHSFTGNIPLNVMLYADNAIVLVILSIVLTLIGGIIPAKAAAKRDPVIALRTE